MFGCYRSTTANDQLWKTNHHDRQLEQQLVVDVEAFVQRLSRTENEVGILER